MPGIHIVSHSETLPRISKEEQKRKFRRWWIGWYSLQFTTRTVLLHFYSRNSKLLSFSQNVAGNRLGSDGARLVTAMIKENTNLRELNLARNNFIDKDAKHFVESLKSNFRLKVNETMPWRMQIYIISIFSNQKNEKYVLPRVVVQQKWYEIQIGNFRFCYFTSYGNNCAKLKLQQNVVTRRIGKIPV